MTVEDLIQNTSLEKSAAVVAFAHTMDNAIGAIGAWLDGLTEKVKESGKSAGIQFKGDPHSMSRLSDNAKSEQPAIPRSKEVSPPQHQLIVHKELASAVATVKIPEGIHQSAHHVADNNLHEVTASAKQVATSQAMVQTHQQQNALG